jgi:hypothetical protein
MVEATPPVVDPEMLRLPFLVDDYFVPNGCFGDANCQREVIDINSRACLDRPATSQSVCRRYSYTPLPDTDPEYQGFLGVLFQDVGPLGEDDIGRVPGLPVEPGARRVTFWAWLGPGQEQVVSFRAGGANNWEGNTDPSLPYADGFGVPLDVTLSDQLTQLEIDLSGVAYEDVVSPFGWAIEAPPAVGTSAPSTIELYIDDLRWE